MVPTVLSAKTAIQAPVSRGTEPRVASTRTHTAGDKARRSKKRVIRLCIQDKGVPPGMLERDKHRKEMHAANAR
jgi:hypothetical protein